MIVAKLSGRLRRAHARGAIRSVRMAIDLAVLQMLQAIFGFDRWHARSPTSRRGYRDGVASLINEMRPLCVVEVGCGLGAILARVKAPERVGYDIDRGVVRAARCLHGRALTFREGGFEDVTQPAIDVLVALNWLHDFAPEQVAAWLVPLLPRTRHVLVDRVEPTSPLSYRHHHDFAFLDGWAVATRIEEFGEEHRRFILYEVC
jgi:SAM-dependent methyltransferase